MYMSHSESYTCMHVSFQEPEILLRSLNFNLGFKSRYIRHLVNKSKESFMKLRRLSASYR